MFSPKNLYEEDLNRIGCYLKLTRDCGLILNTNTGLFKIVSYPDSYFFGIYGNEKSTDTTCVNSCTSYVIKFSDCPVLYQSKLQTETELYTMEVEIFAVAHNCR